MKPVLVTWRDIVDESGWKTQNQVDKFVTKEDDGVVKHLGFLLEEDENQVVIVDSYFPDGSYFGLVTKIPRGCIISITELVTAKETETVDTVTPLVSAGTVAVPLPFLGEPVSDGKRTPVFNIPFCSASRSSGGCFCSGVCKGINPTENNKLIHEQNHFRQSPQQDIRTYIQGS